MFRRSTRRHIFFSIHMLANSSKKAIIFEYYPEDI